MLRNVILICLALVGLTTQALSAQDTGRIIGRVLEAQSAKPVVGAQVFIESAGIGVLSDLNGRYVLNEVPVGSVDVSVSSLGYGAKTVTGVAVTAGQITSLDITVEESALEIEGITIDAEREQGSQAFLLDQRRTATAMVEAVGAAEISRRPDGDAAQVAQRLTGVTVTEGKYVFVRGLGERYSQTSLNGSSLPSPEPEREVVPLDLFPSGFLESLQTQKSYTPDLPADFSGGSVQIETKDFPNEFTFRAGVSSSFNSLSQFQDGFLSYDGGGRDFLGLDDGTRDTPAEAQDFIGDVRDGGQLPSDPQSLLQVSEAFRNTGLGFGPARGSTPLNRSFNLSLGGRTDAGEDGELGFFFAGSYSDSYTIRGGGCSETAFDDLNRLDIESCREFERKWRTSAFEENTAEFALPNVDYAFTRGTRAVAWGTIGNLTWKPNANQKISLKTTLNINSDNEGRTYQGANEEDIGGLVRSERARWIERVLGWGQLSGEHLLMADSRLEWRLTGARATRGEPMMREAIYLQEPTDGQYYLLDDSNSGLHLFTDLVDDDLSGAFDWRFPFELAGSEAAVKFGAYYRNRTRDFGARRLNWNFLAATITDLDEALESGELVTGNPSAPGEFRLEEVVEPGDLYDADDRRVAGYLMFELPVTDRLDAVVGTRVETYALDLNSRGETLQGVDQTDWAPSLNLIYSATDQMKIRGSLSQTVDRPEFRELAPFQFTEATSLRQLFGNPELVPATIRSADLRMDWFPGPGEIISVGGFYKDMRDPVEQVFIAAASSAFSFQNAESAQVLGLELDVQLRLDRFARLLRDFSVQANYSWIDSEVEVRPGGIFFPTNERRPLQGQASYVVNAGLNYAGLSGVQAGLFYNRFGPRLSAAGGSGVPDIYEQPRNSLDANLSFDLPGGVRATIRGTNLLDATYLFDQSLNGFTQVQRQYTIGRTISVGLNWEL